MLYIQFISKYKPETFEGKTKDQMALESIHKCNFATNIMKDVESYKSFNSSDVDRKLKAVSNQLDLYSDLLVQLALKEVVVEQVFT